LSHYFETPERGGQPRTLTLRLGERRLPLRTETGVFSRDRIDPGTGILLEAMPPPPEAGDLLDLGCGYGPISLALATASPEATVWAVDVNELALELCRRNAEAAGVTNVRVCAPDAVPPEVRFAGIWSNPPIRIGKEPLHVLLLDWLGRLGEAAAATLVVQRHLGSDSLQTWLEESGFRTERIASRKGYRVLRCHR
jgi:16S rRNA (guanine1207-N2)-methyltransferase